MGGGGGLLIVQRFNRRHGKKEEGGGFEGSLYPMHTMSKVGGWGVLRNGGGDLSNGGDFEIGRGGGLVLLYKICKTIALYGSTIAY